MTIESVGYEGRLIHEFVAGLRERGTEVLVDVRLNPISRRSGFSKTALRAALSEVGIGYVHLRALGNPKANRPGFANADPTPARETYRALLQAPAAAEELQQLRELVGKHRVAVMCFEADETRCHRQVILEELRGRLTGSPPPPARWLLRQVMAEHGMWHTTDLVQPLRDRGIELSTVQIYRLVAQQPVRLNLQVLAALCDIFDCRADRLIDLRAADSDSGRP
jgi:DNA-binding Xre family transcriptional regulator